MRRANCEPMVRRRMGSDEKILARNSVRKNPTILSFVAFVGCFIMAANLYTVLKPYLRPLHIHFHVESVKAMTPNFSGSTPYVNGNIKMHDFHVVKKYPIISNFSNLRSDVYEIDGDIRIHGNSSTVFIASTHGQTLRPWNIKPYPRKHIFGAMARVRSFKIIPSTADRIPNCSRHLSSPSILFSAGGLAGNHFHAFADVLIPLFLTTHHFNRKTTFLVANYNPIWISKYRKLLENLSKHHIYDIDKENEVLCFSKMIVGLKANKDLEIVPSKPANFSRRNFTKLLRLERQTLNDVRQTVSRPRMLIISRDKSRRLMNEREVADMARGLGFDTIVRKMTPNVSLNAEVVNSFDVMVGVHGAGLTNMVFLPENAVLIQVIPFGLKYFAKICFEGAVESNKLRYLRYNVSLSESTLFGKYPPDSKVYWNTKAVSMDFNYFRSVYLDNQDVVLDLNRFRKTLLRARELVLSVL